MIEPKKEQDESMVQCPVCSGHGETRGAETKIAWFNCGYCNGTGKVTQKRFSAWQDRNTESPAADAAARAEPLTDRTQTDAEKS